MSWFALLCRHGDGKPSTITRFDLFPIVNGKIVEHRATALVQ